MSEETNALAVTLFSEILTADQLLRNAAAHFGDPGDLADLRARHRQMVCSPGSQAGGD